MRPSTLELHSSTDAHRFKYTYGESGNIEKIYENGILSVRYEYDAIGRLTREDNRAFGKTSLWEYDTSGNILSRRSYAFTLKPTEALIESDPEDVLLYEYAGDNLVSLNGTEHIHYCTEGHPDLYRGKAVTWTAPRMLGTYDGNTLTYNSDGLCASINGKPLIYGRDRRLLSDGTFRYLYDENGALFGFLRAADGAEYLYRRDALGNILAILDTEGAVVVQYKYDAWGNHKVLNASGEEIANQNHIGHLNPHRYRGYYYSTELGLYYLKSRFYDAEIGRFICADSLDYLDPHTVGGLNLYAYCGNNPVMNVDPTGHGFWDAFLNVVAAVAVVVVVTAAVVATAGVAAAALGASTAVVAAVTTGAAIGGIAAGTSEIVSQCITEGAENLDIGAVAIETLSGSLFGGTVATVGAVSAPAFLPMGGAAVLATSADAIIVGSGAIVSGLVTLARTSKRGGYYGERWPGDPHKPDHVHLRGNKTDIRIGRDGKPLPGEKKLNSKARKALEQLWDEFVRLFNK